MNIFYILSPYISHLTAGLDYIRCLRELGHQVETNLNPPDQARLFADLAESDAPPAEPPPAAALDAGQLEHARLADVVILHEDPLGHDPIYAAMPFLLEKRVIAYTAWENETLSPYYVAPLGRVSEVWAPSEFCRLAVAPHVKKCAVLPHLVERKPPPAAALDWARNYLNGLQAQLQSGDNRPPFVFLAVVDAVNPRKNMRGLLAAFGLLRRQTARTARPVRLLLKQYRVEMDFGGIEGVASLGGKLAAGRMAALYALCDAYVSAHHSEGWGLGLSSAMAFGKPVIATGYSGNMQFMNEGNSLPVPYEMVPVPKEMCDLVPLFTPQMRWADPDLSTMARFMKLTAEERLDPGLRANAAAITRDFGLRAIMARLAELL